eukprot:1904136-Rhodomonas_salina.1
MKSPSPHSPSSLRERKLSPGDVLEIFALRPMRSEDQTFVPSTAFCRELCGRYGCGDRTIRDIWSRRSWAIVTRPAWNLCEIAADPKARETLDEAVKARIVPAKARRRGRPRGSGVGANGSLQLVSPHASSSTPSAPTHDSPAQVLDAVHEPMMLAGVGASAEEEGEERERHGAALEAAIFSHLARAPFCDPFAQQWRRHPPSSQPARHAVPRAPPLETISSAHLALLRARSAQLIAHFQ